MYAWVKGKRVKSKKYPRVKIGKTLKKEYNIRFKIYPSPFTSLPQPSFHIFVIGLPTFVFLVYPSEKFCYLSEIISYPSEILCYLSEIFILSFGDILLNDSMIFFALYFPNPRKSHKSHR